MDKPLECLNCQEPAAVIYKQVCSKNMSQEVLCKHCPILKQRLQGKHIEATAHETGAISCNECSTQMSDILRHEALGCAHCYEVFQHAICQRLTIDKLDYKQDVMINKNSTPSSEQLLKLSKDLQDAVNEENFEKAAILRDEITKLKKMMSES
jgi:protein arginine kinase activator